jgi:CO dehydrogenase/acetyl-CoA synthase delta subunit
MVYDLNFGWTGTIGQVILGATRQEGGTRNVSYRIGGGTTLPFLDRNPSSSSPLVALEICDNPEYWSPIIKITVVIWYTTCMNGQRRLKRSTRLIWFACT